MCIYSRFSLIIFAFSHIVVHPLPSVAYPSQSSLVIGDHDSREVSLSPAGPNPGDPPGSGNRWTADRFPRAWVSDLFYETLANFTVSKDVGSSACQKQTQMYTRDLKNGSMWAMQMSDSWSRYPNGILVGTTHQMGVYEECINVIRPVQGKYCIPLVRLKTTTGEDFSIGKPDDPHSYDPAWREILGYVNKDTQAHRNEVKFGVCIPDSCSANDLEVSLQREFDSHFLPHQVKAEVEVQSILCSTIRDEFPYDNGFYITGVLVGLVVLICVLSTSYHLLTLTRNSYGKKTFQVPEIVNLFSLIRNGRDLIKYDRNNELNIFNGLKVLTMILILFGHKFLYFAINPMSYGLKLEMVQKVGPDFLLTCMNLVDPFFYITGYLMYVLLISQYSKPGTRWYHVPMIIVYKYLRILPPYVVMMVLTAFIIPHLGNGPLWASRMWPEAESCKNHWLANILAFSNFVDAENQCLIASWYISCLLQLIVIGSVVVYIYIKNRRVGFYLMVLFLCSSLVIPCIMTYTYRGWGIIRITASFLNYPKRDFGFNYLYRDFYLRGSPFFAGLLAGVVVEELKKREIKFSQFVVWAGTLIVVTVCTWVQLYGVVFYDIYRPYNVLEQSLYASLSHCTWTGILFWVTVCHFTTGYGPIEKLFNNRIVVPLGRLSFAVYIVNITIMMIIESKQRVALYPSQEFIVDGWIFGAFRTYFAAALLYLFFEAPLGLLIKKLLYGKIYNKKDHVSTTVTNKSETEHNNSTHL